MGNNNVAEIDEIWRIPSVLYIVNYTVAERTTQPPVKQLIIQTLKMILTLSNISDNFLMTIHLFLHIVSGLPSRTLQVHRLSY